jgi:saccharopine dehydrogenase (NAD+, L-glutamate forming)
MKKILVIGAGRSSANLIKYLLEQAPIHDWQLRVGDMDQTFAKQKIGNSTYGTAFSLNAADEQQRRSEIANADLVISMLPAAMHMEVAKDCLHFGKNVITPSYIPDDMWALDADAKAKGIVILNEMGVDPGIDHMSAMKIIHHLKAQGATLQSFESFTGGLIAPESDNNPWNYKITWNPRNVILAGYGGTARFKEDGTQKFIPYQRLFERVTPVDLGNDGQYDGYANRDSLKYLKLYDLEEIPTLYRGTLRKAGYCTAWNSLVQLGLTDDSFAIEDLDQMTWDSLTRSFLPSQEERDTAELMRDYLNLSDSTMSKLTWLGIFEKLPVGISKGTPAQALQHLIENKWVLGADDKDLIVMWHRFRYAMNGMRYELQSTLLTQGDDPVHTAMSKTVGLPIAIAAKFILTGEWKLSGVQLPTKPEIYNPVLNELSQLGVQFKESVKEIH